MATELPTTNGHSAQDGENTFAVKAGLARMLKGGVIMDVVNAEQVRLQSFSARYTSYCLCLLSQLTTFESPFSPRSPLPRHDSPPHFRLPNPNSKSKSKQITDNSLQARIAEEAGASAVMALERVPADIRVQGGVARMSDPKMIKEIMDTVTIPVMAKARIGHFVECQVCVIKSTSAIWREAREAEKDKDEQIEEKK